MSNDNVSRIAPTGVMTLIDGTAEMMGGGLFIVIQQDEAGMVHSVVLSALDLTAMLETTIEQVVPLAA